MNPPPTSCRPLRLTGAVALAWLLAAPGFAQTAAGPLPPANTLEAARTRPSFTLERLLLMAADSSPLLAAGRAEVDVARAQTITARARPNPEVSIEPGRLRQSSDAASGTSTILSIGQPIENPWLREARIRSAEGGIDVARTRVQSQGVNLAASIRSRFNDVARVDEEIAAYTEDLQLTEQIRDRIRVRVRSGEAPRFDLVRAEGEVEAARKNLSTARLRKLQVLSELRGLVGPALPEDYEINTAMRSPAEPDAPGYTALRERLIAQNPDLQLAVRQVEQAERQLELERRSVIPQVTLRASRERDPEASITRFGAVVTVPLVNRREGPIAEANAEAERARRVLEQRRYELLSAFETVWRGLATAQARVQAIESGVLDRARSALEIAEAAYRLGERGILEFLDAQRQFRLARNELITARFELRNARSELERLLGTP